MIIGFIVYSMYSIRYHLTDIVYLIFSLTVSCRHVIEPKNYGNRDTSRNTGNNIVDYLIGV